MTSIHFSFMRPAEPSRCRRESVKTKEDGEENGYKITQNLLTVYKVPATDSD